MQSIENLVEAGLIHG